MAKAKSIVKVNVAEPLNAIKLKRLMCKQWDDNLVWECNTTECPLFYFRLGENPYKKKRMISEETHEKICTALAKGRATRMKNIAERKAKRDLDKLSEAAKNL